MLHRWVKIAFSSLRGHFHLSRLRGPRSAPLRGRAEGRSGGLPARGRSRASCAPHTPTGRPPGGRPAPRSPAPGGRARGRGSRRRSGRGGWRRGRW
nr:MAG TPA: hypothetical protein [Siphoviridae sp. ctvS314]